MFKIIKEALQLAKNEDVDLSVALRMLKDEFAQEELDKAERFIAACYGEITYLNKNGDTESLDKICSLGEEGKYLEVKSFAEELKGSK